MQGDSKRLSTWNSPGKNSMTGGQLLLRLQKANQFQRYYQPYSSISKKHYQILMRLIAKIIKRKLQNTFHHIHYYEKKKLNLQLLKGKKNKFLKQGFFRILSVALIKKQNKFVKIEQNIKKTKIWLRIIRRHVKSKKKQPFIILKEAYKKYLKVKNFLTLLENSCSSFDLLQNKKHFYNKIKTSYLNNRYRNLMLKKTVLLLKNARRRRKQEGFYQIINYIYQSEGQRVKNTKQNLSQKVSLKNSNRFKILSEEKDRLRSARNHLIDKSSAKNRSHYSSKKQIKSLKQQKVQKEKANKKTKQQVQKDIEKNKKAIEEFKKANSQTLERKKKAKNMMKKTLNAFNTLFKSKQNHESKIAMTKNIVMDVKNISIIDDPFAIAFNFKIRNEINKYENRTFSNDQHSQFQTVVKENALLKQILKSNLQKQLLEYVNKSDFQAI